MDSAAMSSTTFSRDVSFQVGEDVAAVSLSPSGRDAVLAGLEGINIVDLDDPYATPRSLPYRVTGIVTEVQWSPWAQEPGRIVSTANNVAVVWDVEASTPRRPVYAELKAHQRTITDVNLAGTSRDALATCGIDSYIYLWDLRSPQVPHTRLADWRASASQVKWNKQDGNILASSHERNLHIWDVRRPSAPVKTFAAHKTKIYGIDWHRDRHTCILTCSLDKTIKFWNWHHPHNPCDQIIQTRYPVWRARYTPMGSGKSNFLVPVLAFHVLLSYGCLRDTSQ